jgi:hypothetical protein
MRIHLWRHLALMVAILPLAACTAGIQDAAPGAHAGHRTSRAPQRSYRLDQQPDRTEVPGFRDPCSSRVCLHEDIHRFRQATISGVTAFKTASAASVAQRQACGTDSKPPQDEANDVNPVRADEYAQDRNEPLLSVCAARGHVEARPSPVSFRSQRPRLRRSCTEPGSRACHRPSTRT